MILAEVGCGFNLQFWLFLKHQLECFKLVCDGFRVFVAINSKAIFALKLVFSKSDFTLFKLLSKVTAPPPVCSFKYDLPSNISISRLSIISFLSFFEVSAAHSNLSPVL